MWLNTIRWVLQHPIHIFCVNQNSVIEKHRFSCAQEKVFKVFCEWICTNRHSGVLIHVTQYNSVSSTTSNTYFLCKSKFSHRKTQIFVCSRKGFLKYFVNESAQIDILVF